MVRTIYNLYLDGYPTPVIADLLTKSGIPTVKGCEKWSSGAVLNILKNEKFCGDALCQKTVTLDPLTHECVKNKGLEPQYYIEDHHTPIVSKEDWKLTQQIIKEKRYLRKKSKRYRKPKVIVKGALSGFVIVDPRWDEKDVENIV